MPPKNHYTDSEMRRMQQDAIARVREMQSRSRLTPEEADQATAQPPNYSGRNFRNWSTNPNIQRQKHRSRQPPKTEEPPRPSPEAEAPPPPPPAEEPEQNGEGTTLLQDILGAVGLDDDRVLIIGLLFILINAKADTTLILALMYLLI